MLTARVLRASLYDRALPPNAVAASAGVESQFVAEKTLIAALTPAQRATRAKQTESRDAIQTRIHKLEAAARGKMYTVVPRNPGVMRVHVRGSVTEYGPEVSPGGVAAVRGVQAELNLPKNASDAERRKRLAAWITDPKNDLFSR